MGKLQTNTDNAQTTIAPMAKPATAEERRDAIHKMLGARSRELEAHLGKAMVDRFRRAAAAHYLAMASASERAARDLASVDLHSYVAACMTAALDGLTPDGRDGWILIRKGIASWTISWRGMVKLARRACTFHSFTAEIVYQVEIDRGGFDVDLAERTIKHRPWYLLGVREQPTDNEVALVYAAATMVGEDGTTSREFRILTDAEVVKRARMSGNPNNDQPSDAWVNWHGPMAKKTAVRALLDMLPVPDRVWDAIGRDDERVQQVEPVARSLAAVTPASELAAHVRGQISAAPPIDTEARDADAPRVPTAHEDDAPHVMGGE